MSKNIPFRIILKKKQQKFLFSNQHIVLKNIDELRKGRSRNVKFCFILFLQRTAQRTMSTVVRFQLVVIDIIAKIFFDVLN